MAVTINTAIKGTAALYGVIGDPVAHSISPIIHNTIAAMLGDDLAYVPLHVRSDDLGQAVNGAAALGIKGLNVTIPHKKAVMQYCKEIDAEAFQVGAVNTLLLEGGGYKGYNTDVFGLEETLDSRGINIGGKRVLILGAGGAAYAVGIMAAKRGASKIIIINRTKKNADNLAVQIKKYYNDSVQVIGYDNMINVSDAHLIINTTPVGMSGQGRSPVDDSCSSVFSGCEAVFDIIYTSLKTPLMLQAEAYGCRTVNGLDMLVYQGIRSYEIWRGVMLAASERLAIRNTIWSYYYAYDYDYDFEYDTQNT